MRFAKRECRGRGCLPRHSPTPFGNSPQHRPKRGGLERCSYASVLPRIAEHNDPHPTPFPSPPEGTVLTIGTFDGVHLGHRALVERAVAVASAVAAGGGKRAHVVVLAFDPSPMEVLSPEKAPARLTTFAQREKLLREAGADRVVRLVPTTELLALEPAEFVSRLVAEYRPRAIVEGADFRFGARRGGDVGLLRSLGETHGFSVELVEQVELSLSDNTVAPARSTAIRSLVAQGRVSDATCLLGRPYAMAGKVVPGDRRGRTIGFPTANLDSPCLAPADGVYAGRARLADGRVMAAAISVGTKPTFGPHRRAVEAYLIDDSRTGLKGEAWAPIDGLPEYGWEMELEFLAFLRDQVQFATVEALLEQMGRDCAECAEICRRTRA